MAIDSASFKTRFPEFASVDDARIDLFIGDAEVILNESYWGDKYDLGLYYLTAHYLKLAILSEAGPTPGIGGPVSSRAVDGVSVSYAVATLNDQSDAYYSQTTYGQRYLALRKNLGIPACVI